MSVLIALIAAATATATAIEIRHWWLDRHRIGARPLRADERAAFRTGYRLGRLDGEHGHDDEPAAWEASRHG